MSEFKFIEQPIEGLLYDLDLLPEQCRIQINERRRVVVEEQYKDIQRLKDENSDLILANKVSETLAKSQGEYIKSADRENDWLIEHYAKDMVIQNNRLDDDHDWEDYKKEIVEELQKALKGGEDEGINKGENCNGI